MKSKKTILLILIIVASMIPEVRGITPQDQTVHITDTHDDAFITEVGIGIDTSLVTVKDPDMDIRAYLVFRELDINYWEPLKNATLRLHTSTNLDFDADSSITIYGMKLSDLQLEGYLIPSTVLNIGFTTARTDYNTSEFYGQQWHEIDVTAIVDELIRNPKWDGDGQDGTETGDAIGFHILGAEGYDKRYFYDSSVGNGLEAQLILHWNHEPPPPVGGAQFIKVHGKNYTIWYDPADWLNFSTFDHVGVDNKESQRNDTYFYVTSMYCDSDSYLRRDYDTYRDDINPNINIRFGINITALPWSVTNAYVILWSVSYDHDVAFDYDKGFVFTISIRADQFVLNAWSVDGELLKDNLYYGPSPWEFELPRELYFNITMNMETFVVTSYVYEDIEMTILNGTYTDTFTSGPAWAGGSWLTYEYVNGATEDKVGPMTGYSGAHISDYDEGQYIVTDENGTIVQDDLDTLEDAEDWIELIDPDPEDPNPGGSWTETGPFTRFRTRLYILLLGFLMLLGPLFYMVSQRPSGYEIVIGLFIMLIGYAFLRAAAGI